MLAALRGRVGDRKMRLFACACCRRVWDLLPNDSCRRAVEAAEGYADGTRSRKDLVAARNGVNATIGPIDPDEEASPSPPSLWALCSAGETLWACNYGTDAAAAGTAARDARYARQGREAAEAEAQCRLLRDIFGPLLFGPAPTISPGWLAWNDGFITRLAQAIYEERDFERMPILGDALEEAG
jgi:hypothetical protein